MHCIRNLLTAAAVSLLMFNFTACASKPKPFRTSGVKHVSPDRLQAVINAPSKQVSDQLILIFQRQGFDLVNAASGESSKVLVFKKNRTLRTRVPAAAARTQPAAPAEEIGSWFAARIEPNDAKTAVMLIGKPTLRGQEVCSDEDKKLDDVKYWCVDTAVAPGFPYREHLTGRIEAEVGTGVIKQLKSLYSGKPKRTAKIR